MPVLSIIACRMLEDELTHVLAGDNKLHHLIVVDSADNQGLTRKLRALNRPFRVVDLSEIPSLLQKNSRQRKRRLSDTSGRKRRLVDTIRRLIERVCADDLTVVIHVLGLGLHVDSPMLRDEIYDQIERLSCFSDRIFVFYGICDALRNVKSDFDDHACSLSFLMDEDETMVDDCIALALGGNRSYQEILANDNDVVLFLTPMWAAHWDDLRDDCKLLKHTRFKSVAKVDTGLCYEPNFDDNVHHFARKFTLKAVELQGNVDIAQRCYQRAKRDAVE